MAHILYVAAASPERDRILKRLRNARLDVHAASSGREAVIYLRAHRPDLCFVDVTTLRGNPANMLKRLRNSSPGTAFVVVTTGAAPDSFPQADAHLRKPFTTRTFKARVQQALRRREEDIVRAGPFELDTRLRRLDAPTGTFHLTRVETRLMREFMSHPGEVLARGHLVQNVWETDYVDDTRTLDVHVHWLRKKIEPNIARPRYLVTVHRVGYAFYPDGKAEHDRADAVVSARSP